MKLDVTTNFDIILNTWVKWPVALQHKSVVSLSPLRNAVILELSRSSCYETRVAKLLKAFLWF